MKKFSIIFVVALVLAASAWYVIGIQNSDVEEAVAIYKEYKNEAGLVGSYDDTLTLVKRYGSSVLNAEIEKQNEEGRKEYVKVFQFSGRIFKEVISAEKEEGVVVIKTSNSTLDYPNIIIRAVMVSEDGSWKLETEEGNDPVSRESLRKGIKDFLN